MRRAAAIASALRGLQPTLRVQRVGWEPAAARRAAGLPTIFAMLHGHLGLFAGAHIGEEITGLVSRSRDGQLAAEVLTRLGYGVVRGSSSRGGSAGLRGLLRVLSAGGQVAVTVDGPRGPSGAVAPGVVALARLAEAAVVPIRAAAWPAVRLPTWDAAVVPVPGARVTLRYGQPVGGAGEPEALLRYLSAALAEPIPGP